MFIMIEIPRRMFGRALSPTVSVFAIRNLALSIPPFPCCFCYSANFLCGSLSSRRGLIKALFQRRKYVDHFALALRRRRLHCNLLPLYLLVHRCEKPLAVFIAILFGLKPLR